MGAHIWLFPWLAAVCSAAAALIALAAGRQSFCFPKAASTPRGFFVVWALVLVIGIVASAKLSVLLGAEWVTPRGLVLGAIGGALVAWAGRRSADNSFWLAPLIIGLVTLVVAIGRLWLGYAEIDGLMSISLGMALSLLCLSVAPAALAPAGVDPAYYATGRGVAAMIYAVALIAGVQLGFSKAEIPEQMYWADIPLLLGGALSLALVLAAAIAHGRFSRAAWPVVTATIVVLLTGTLLAWWAQHEWVILATLAAGAVVGLLGLGLNRSTVTAASSRLGGYVAALLLVLAATLSFAFWSGYGIAVLALGLWVICAAPVFGGKRDVAPPLLIGPGFAALLLLYRLAQLQSGSAVRATGPGDIWDLFAICIGALLPVIVSEWVRFEAADLRFPRSLVLFEWLVALILPAMALEYIWQPRSLAGIYLGLALGLLFANRTRPQSSERDPLAGVDRVTISAVLISLVQFEFLPMLAHINSPTRIIRVSVVLILAALLIIRLYLPAKSTLDAAAPVVPAAEV